MSNFEPEKWLLKVFNPEGNGPEKKKEPIIVGRISTRDDGHLWINPDVIMGGNVLGDKLQQKDPETGQYPDKKDIKVEDPRTWILYAWRTIPGNGEPDKDLPTKIGKVSERLNGDLSVDLAKQIYISPWDKLSAEPEADAIARREAYEARRAQSGVPAQAVS